MGYLPTFFLGNAFSRFAISIAERAASAPPEEADRLYRMVAERLREAGLPVETGLFQARMQVSLVNDGPVTIVLETPGSG